MGGREGRGGGYGREGRDGGYGREGRRGLARDRKGIASIIHYRSCTTN